MSNATVESSNAVTEITRRAIVDELELEGIHWWGDMDEVDFLSRLYDLDSLPSHDGRFSSAKNDIWQHRVNNDDWDNRWIFKDSRFDLMNASDDTFLRFLCESIHPAVRRDREQALAVAALLNRHLSPDGWELAERKTISGRPVYAPRRLMPDGKLAVSAAKRVANTVDADYIHQQISRLENAIESDPELAIGTAKEFAETVCKTILEDRKVAFESGIEFAKLVRAVLAELKLLPDDIPDQSKVVEPVRILLRNLASVSHSLAEIRNKLGTGHGKSPTMKGLKPRHARLAVHSATALAVFLYETHQDRLSVS